VANEDALSPLLSNSLHSNYPNPFNPETTIRYSVKGDAPVAIEIYNIKGQLVKTLVNGVQAAGDHSVVWNGTDMNNKSVGNGVYYFKMNSGKYSRTRKMILMK
jgi:flagellar hook assembly protein FlgD